MERKKIITEIADAKAKRFLSDSPDKTGLLEFLMDGFSGLNELPDTELERIHSEVCKPVTQSVVAPVVSPTVVTLTPKDFTAKKPEQSVMVQPGYEIVAMNIMIILSRTGNTFRELTWDEYVTERKKEKNFSEAEKQYFLGVIGYCKEAESALLLSPVWAALKTS